MVQIENQKWDGSSRIKLDNEDLQKLLPKDIVNWCLPVTNGTTVVKLSIEDLKKIGIYFEDLECNIYKENGNIYLEVFSEYYKSK